MPEIFPHQSFDDQVQRTTKFRSLFCNIKQNTYPLVTFETFISAAITQQSTHEYGRINHVKLKRNDTPDRTVHGAIMGPTWVLSAPDRPHVGPMNLAIRDYITTKWAWEEACVYMMWYMVHVVIFIPVQMRGITACVTAVNIYDMHHIFSSVFAATLCFICPEKHIYGYHINHPVTRNVTILFIKVW